MNILIKEVFQHCIHSKAYDKVIPPCFTLFFFDISLNSSESIRRKNFFQG